MIYLMIYCFFFAIFGKGEMASIPKPELKEDIMVPSKYEIKFGCDIKTMKCSQNNRGTSF